MSALGSRSRRGKDYILVWGPCPERVMARKDLLPQHTEEKAMSSVALRGVTHACVASTLARRPRQRQERPANYSYAQYYRPCWTLVKLIADVTRPFHSNPWAGRNQ